MITIFRKENVSTKGNEREIEIKGLSTDTKPTEINSKEITNGTVFIEIDTGDIYMYDAVSSQWKEL